MVYRKHIFSRKKKDPYTTFILVTQLSEIFQEGSNSHNHLVTAPIKEMTSSLLSVCLKLVTCFYQLNVAECKQVQGKTIEKIYVSSQIHMKK